MSAPLPDTEFIELWARADLTSLEIAARLGVTQRAANKRAQGLGLPAKGQRAGRIQRASAQLMRAAGAGAEGEALPPWMLDPDLRPLFDELWQGLREARTAQDVVKLRPLQLRLHSMTALRFPGAIDLLQVLSESAKLILASQKVEADLPPARDEALLRQRAACQLMKELGSVLSYGEQEELGRLIQMAADRLVARDGREARPALVAADVVVGAGGGVPAVRAPW